MTSKRELAEFYTTDRVNVRDHLDTKTSAMVNKGLMKLYKRVRSAGFLDKLREFMEKFPFIRDIYFDGYSLGGKQ